MRRSRSRRALRVTALSSATLVMLGLGAAYTAGYSGVGEIPEPDFSDGGAVSSAAAADQYVTGTSTGFEKDPDAKYTRQSVTTTARGLNYVSYSRTYKNLPVFVGGDVVVVTDGKGTVKSGTTTSGDVEVSTTPKITAAKAEKVSLLIHPGDVAGEPKLGVIASDGKDRLVWEVVIESKPGAEASRAHAYVDARTGRYAGSWDEITGGTGQGHYGGQVTIGTTAGSGGFEMRDPSRGGMRTLNDRTGQVFTDADDKWGNGTGSDLATGAVDTQYAGGVMWDMLKAKFNRNGIDGKGGTASMFVGLTDVNAFYSCAGTGDANRDQTKYGRTSDGARQVNSVDVVAHELGHGVFCHTPGGSRGTTNETGGLNEATGDIFGTLAEHFAANPNDPADFLVGEEVNLTGRGPIRNMHTPSAAGDPNCFSSSIPTTEVHSAAGPLNHWFYLVSEGSAPAGKPASATCNGSRVTGIGLWPAGEIFYHGLLRKTSGWTYTKARKATLEAARELHPDSCTEFNVVKAAWDAVSVPSQGDPACNVTAPQPTPTTPAPPTSPTPSAPATTSPSPATPGTTAPTGAPVASVDIDATALRADLAEFARIAQANSGNRAHGTTGYKASLDHLKQRLDAAGYATRVQQFTHAGRTGYNLIADLPGRGDPNRVVMLGAHLDSVNQGPGINDNATGSAGILEVALAYAASGAQGDKGVRFGWWGAEEAGLVGSKAYVASLSSAERAKVTAYLNFDMIGSPNPGYFLYGDDTRGTAIAAALKAGFAAEGIEPESTDLNGRSDHASFMAAGIPTGGTATLSLAPSMSQAQAAKWDGEAGKPFDPCYHKACDGAGNVDHDALDTHADVAAHALWALTGVKAPAEPTSTRVENGADFAIKDRSAIESPITVQRSGQAPAALKVEATIRHGFRGDLEIHLIAPDGTAYQLKKSSRFDSADDVRLSQTVDASAEQASGTWKLRVRDLYTGDTGTLDTWALTF